MLLKDGSTRFFKLPLDERGLFALPAAPDEEAALDATTPIDARPRIARDLRRLEALAGRRRWRVRGLRAARGLLGAGATLGTLIKLKLAGSLGLKLALAGLVGLGFAWPLAVLGLLAVLVLLLSVVSLFSGEGGPGSVDCDCPCACSRKEARAARLKDLIARRRAWLAAPSGPAPSARAEPVGRSQD